jgi:hypothetical protein
MFFWVGGSRVAQRLMLKGLRQPVSSISGVFVIFFVAWEGRACRVGWVVLGCSSDRKNQGSAMLGGDALHCWGWWSWASLLRLFPRLDASPAISFASIEERDHAAPIVPAAVAFPCRFRPAIGLHATFSAPPLIKSGGVCTFSFPRCGPHAGFVSGHQFRGGCVTGRLQSIEGATGHLTTREGITKLT